jgi:hypothetical protein
MQAATDESHASAANTRQREHRRVMFSVPFSLCRIVAEGIRFSHGVSTDISEGGLGAIVEGALRVGERVQVNFPSHLCNLNTLAIVRHTSSVRSGFQFVGLNDSDRRQIAEITRVA